MKQVTVSELIGNPADVLSVVRSGEEVAVLENGHQVATILPQTNNLAEARPFGLAKRTFVVPADFNAPLPEETLQEFEER